MNSNLKNFFGSISQHQHYKNTEKIVITSSNPPTSLHKRLKKRNALPTLNQLTSMTTSHVL